MHYSVISEVQYLYYYTEYQFFNHDKKNTNTNDWLVVGVDLLSFVSVSVTLHLSTYALVDLSANSILIWLLMTEKNKDIWAHIIQYNIII